MRYLTVCTLLTLAFFMLIAETSARVRIRVRRTRYRSSTSGGSSLKPKITKTTPIKATKFSSPVIKSQAKLGSRTQLFTQFAAGYLVTRYLLSVAPVYRGGFPVYGSYVSIPEKRALRLRSERVSLLDSNGSLCLGQSSQTLSFKEGIENSLIEVRTIVKYQGSLTDDKTFTGIKNTVPLKDVKDKTFTVTSRARYRVSVVENTRCTQVEKQVNGTMIQLYEYNPNAGPCPTNRSLKGMSGSLMSPNFPNNYEPEQQCSWIISVPQGYHVRLFFDHATEFHIPSCTNKTCDCDFLEVRQGRSSEGKLLGTYCGRTIPSPIYARGSDVWLRFVTDKNSNSKGFNMTFEAIYSLADDCPWNKTLTGHRGFINSPLFALDYPGNIDCMWRIHVTGNHRVAFVFLGPINLDPNCTDVLEIRDGLDARSPLLRRYCSSEPTPQTIFSSGREMYVRFKSDGYDHRNVFRDESVAHGFHATYFVTRVKSDTFILKGSIFTMALTVFLCTFR